MSYRFYRLLPVTLTPQCPGAVAPPYFDVEGLEPGHQYQFRVTAVNDEGDSEPLEAEQAITAKNPYGEWIASQETYGKWSGPEGLHS